MKTLAPRPLFIKYRIQDKQKRRRDPIVRRSTVLQNVSREAFQKVTQTPFDELKKRHWVFIELRDSSKFVEEDLQYIIIIDEQLWEEFLMHTLIEQTMERVQQSLLENAVFKFDNAEVTAKLLIPGEVMKQAGL